MHHYTKEEAEKIKSILDKEKTSRKISELTVQKTLRTIIANGKEQFGHMVYIRMEDGKHEYPVNLLGPDYQAIHKSLSL